MELKHAYGTGIERRYDSTDSSDAFRVQQEN